MKLNVLKNGLVALFISTAIMSCESDEVAALVEEAITTDDITVIDEVDVVLDEVTASIEQAFIIEEAIGTLTSKDSGEKGLTDFFPACLTKTVVIEQNMKVVTLDFGEGCEVRGRFMAGILIMSYEKDPELQTRTITTTFDNYRVNRKLIEGSHSIVRVRENENGNPQATSTFDVMITWDNGDTASRVGEKVRELIEGADTRVWSDNVYSITGHWATVRKNGTTVNAAIITALRREMVCRFLVSGVIDLTKNDRSGTLDFGDGTCDNEALLTLDDGTEIVIVLH